MNKIEVPEVDEVPGKVGENEDWIHLVDGVSQQDQPSSQAEVPEGDRNHALLFLLRCDPLDQETHGKHGLADKTNNDPEVDPELRVLLNKI